MTEHEILSHFQKVKKNGKGWVALCPAHEDRNPSLSITETDGKWLLHCHAGCEYAAVVDAAGLREAFTVTSKTGPQIVAEYDYVDEAGKQMYQVVRYAPKDFRQRRRVNGEWVWKLENTRRVLYRLPEVLAAVAAGSTVYVVEGEKDVHALEHVGAVATCNAGGAGKWRDEYSATLAGAPVIIIADKDEPGHKHAAAVAASVRSHAASVAVVEAAEGKDAADHLRAGKTLQEFVPVADAAPAPRIRAYTLPELAALQPEQVDWVLGNYIAVGDVASLESPPKVGKSTFARKLHVHVATGTPFLGCAVKQGPSLYCTEERAGTSREGFARAGGLELADIHVMFLHDFHGMEWAEKVEEIAEHCQRLGVVLVTFDTLSKWAGLAGEEEQSSGSAMEVMTPLQRLAATGRAVLPIRHERKSGGATGEAGRGSSAFTGDLDVILSLRKVVGEPTRRKLGAVGRHDATPDEVVIDYVDGEYVSLGDPHDVRKREQERGIVDALPLSRAEQATVEDINERVDGAATPQTVRRLLLRLVDEGVVCRAHGEVPDHPRSDGFWLRGDYD